ncbi:hypothetical protein EJ07DRAFT_107279, partial [Lizonia empirigonia]
KDERQEFAIHEALLVARSKYFRNCMQNGWKEAEEKRVKLDDVSPAVFALYEQLVYTGLVPGFETESCEREYVSLTSLYVLSERLQDIEAKNSAIDALMSKATHESATSMFACHLPSPEAVSLMYDNTPHHCPGRQAIVDCFVWFGQDHSMDMFGSGTNYCKEFLSDLSKALMACRVRPEEGHPFKRLGTYHESEGKEWNMEWWLRSWPGLWPTRALQNTEEAGF